MKLIPSLNGLRALSVLLVIGHHFELYYRYRLRQPVPEAWFVFYNGDLGVNVFFVISGFLITTLLLQEEVLTKTISLKSFYLRRTLRIFPAYYFLLFVYGVMQVLHLVEISAGSWVSALTYTKNIFFGEWWLSHAWSLSLEEQFYLCWPLIFMLSEKGRKRFAWVVVAVVPLLRLISYQYGVGWAGSTANLQRIDALMWGCLVAIYHKQILVWVQTTLAKYKWLVLAPFLFLIGSYYFNLVNAAYHLHTGPLIVAFGNQNGTLVYIAIGLVMLISIHYTNNGWFAFLNSRLLNYLGKLSYSIYLWQQLFIGTNFLVSEPPLNLLCIFIAANFSYYFIEKPFLRMRSKLPSLNKKPVRPLIDAPVVCGSDASLTSSKSAGIS